MTVDAGVVVIVAPEGSLEAPSPGSVEGETSVMVVGGPGVAEEAAPIGSVDEQASASKRVAIDRRDSPVLAGKVNVCVWRAFVV